MRIILNILILVFVTLFVTCKEEKQNTGQSMKNSKNGMIDSLIKVNGDNIPIDSNQYYIPLVFLKDSSSRYNVDSFVDSWYSKMLFALREPLLYNNKLHREIFRFTWLRTFRHPVSIRIENNIDGEKYIYWKVTSGAGGYEPGNLILNKSKKIAKSDWRKFLKLVKESNFWNLPTMKDNRGFDGSEWILEGSDDDFYHVVSRWLGSDKSFHACCSYLITLTDLEINKKDMY